MERLRVSNLGSPRRRLGAISCCNPNPAIGGFSCYDERGTLVWNAAGRGAPVPNTCPAPGTAGAPPPGGTPAGPQEAIACPAPDGTYTLVDAASGSVLAQGVPPENLNDYGYSITMLADPCADARCQPHCAPPAPPGTGSDRASSVVQGPGNCPEMTAAEWQAAWNAKSDTWIAAGKNIFDSICATVTWPDGSRRLLQHCLFPSGDAAGSDMSVEDAASGGIQSCEDQWKRLCSQMRPTTQGYDKCSTGSPALGPSAAPAPGPSAGIPISNPAPVAGAAPGALPSPLPVTGTAPAGAPPSTIPVSGATGLPTVPIQAPGIVSPTAGAPSQWPTFGNQTVPPSFPGAAAPMQAQPLNQGSFAPQAPMACAMSPKTAEQWLDSCPEMKKIRGY